MEPHRRRATVQLALFLFLLCNLWFYIVTAAHRSAPPALFEAPSENGLEDFWAFARDGASGDGVSPDSVASRHVQEGAHFRRLANNDAPLGGVNPIRRSFQRLSRFITDLVGDASKTYKRLKLRMRKRLPWSWRRFLASLPLIDEKRFTDFPETWPKSRERYKVMLLSHVTEKLADFLKLDSETREHGIAIKAFGTQGNSTAEDAVNEINAHKNMVPKNPFILPFLGAYRSTTGQLVYLVTPRLQGDLYTAIRGAKKQTNVKLALAEMVYSLKLMHDFGFVHRDIKLGNYFVDFTGHVVLADFEGAADKTMWLDSAVDFIVYTNGFLAPEINLKDDWLLFTEKTDVYALGVCFRTFYQVFKNDIPDARRLSALVRKMLAPNPADRYTMKQVMESEYFRGIDFSTLEDKKQGVPFPGDLQSYRKFA